MLHDGQKNINQYFHNESTAISIKEIIFLLQKLKK